MNSFSGTTNANESHGPKDPAAFNDESDSATTSEPGNSPADNNDSNLDDVVDEGNGNPDSNTLSDAAQSTDHEEISID